MNGPGLYADWTAGSPPAGGDRFPSDGPDVLDLDKAWDGLHHLLAKFWATAAAEVMVVMPPPTPRSAQSSVSGMSVRGGGHVMTVMTFRLADHAGVRWVETATAPAS